MTVLEYCHVMLLIVVFQRSLQWYMDWIVSLVASFRANTLVIFLL